MDNPEKKYEKLTIEQMEQYVAGMGDALKDVMYPGVGYALFLFDFGYDGNTAYISTADRDDMKRFIKEWLERQSTQSGPEEPKAET